MRPIYFSSLCLTAASYLTKVTIESYDYKDSYLSLDGTDVTEHTKTGGGAVGVRSAAGNRETFWIETDYLEQTFSIRSTEFDRVYLRLSGEDMDLYTAYPDGAGEVNANYEVGENEKFRWEIQDSSSWAIVSVKSPARYLRIVGPNTEGIPEKVNVQNYFGEKMRFKIHFVE